jgi:hypothetical protein
MPNPRRRGCVGSNRVPGRARATVSLVPNAAATPRMLDRASLEPVARRREPARPMPPALPRRAAVNRKWAAPARIDPGPSQTQRPRAHPPPQVSSAAPPLRRRSGHHRLRTRHPPAPLRPPRRAPPHRRPRPIGLAATRTGGTSRPGRSKHPGARPIGLPVRLPALPPVQRQANRLRRRRPLGHSLLRHPRRRPRVRLRPSLHPARSPAHHRPFPRLPQPRPVSTSRRHRLRRRRSLARPAVPILVSSASSPASRQAAVTLASTSCVRSVANVWRMEDGG